MTAQHDTTVSAICVADERAVDLDKFNTWVSNVLSQNESDIFRTKAILRVTGPDSDHLHVLQGVHAIYQITKSRAWRDDESKRSRIVFIGRHLDPIDMKASFTAHCFNE